MFVIRRIAFSYSFLFASFITCPSYAVVLSNKDKLPEDPTKVVTQIGANYSGDLSFTGSVSLGKSRKINANVNADGSEWRLGGSWLFDIGIVNFKFGKNQYDHDAEQNNYSVGTHLPLSYFDFMPFGWQIFVMGGYSYNHGETACKVSTGDCAVDISASDEDYILQSSHSNAGFAGLAAMRALGNKWTLMTMGAYSVGSDHYSGYFAGIGMGYHITKRQSLSLKGKIQDNTYGQETKVGLGYRYQFN